MSDIHSYSTTAGSNNSASPNGFPEGQSPSSLNDSAREVMAALARWYQDQNGTLTSTGSSNAYVVAGNQTYAALNDIGLLVFRANFTNTGSATLNVDSLGAKTIKKNHDQNLSSGDIEANQIVVVAYNATDDTFELICDKANTDQEFDSGTRMLFQQETAPTGWTIDTTLNDAGLRLVDGSTQTFETTASPGGSVAFSTVFGRTATDGHQLTISEMPAHTHTNTRVLKINPGLAQVANVGYTPSGTENTGSTGGNGSHTHDIDLQLTFADVIVAAKD